jgi:transcriptional regulator GlxA family with amidase domain
MPAEDEIIAVEFLNDRLGEKISLEELANAAGLSQYHLIRVFKKSCGLTPHAYLTQQRINRASSLLKNGETPLSEIALATGFTDQCHFTKTFRSLTGATPGRFRTAWRNRAG